ncbi:hypothetical protein BYT27DRAFT_7158082 [Phlegmacium glaucopus]|nr:hypothetical protein BYT27DRAFT_7158082 [Phlegmacium glaucopus]
MHSSPASEIGSAIDRITTLCLACSSSLPPSKTINDASTTIYLTKCCHRPICPSCISSNPRLARYDPCLFCLGGVGLVGMNSPSSSQGQRFMDIPKSTDMNINGEVRDQDTFVLGDDDEEEEDEKSPESWGGDHDASISSPLPPLDESIVDPWKEEESPLQEAATILTPNSNFLAAETKPAEPDNTRPYKYYIKRSDTLQGISLRFGIDSHEICKMNNLSPSTIRMTPHLLHTRAFLILPPTIKPHPSLKPGSAEEKAREAKLVRERAEKKVQILTKEVDWRVAKAYVALADDRDEQEDFQAKRKEIGGGGSNAGGLESLAIEKYLDDEEWETEERRAGRGIQFKRL